MDTRGVIPLLVLYLVEHAFGFWSLFPRKGEMILGTAQDRKSIGIGMGVNIRFD